MNDLIYTGSPPDFAGWISKHVFGKKGDPVKENNSYRIFMSSDGKCGLQETHRLGTDEVERRAKPWRNKVVGIGTFGEITENHIEYTGKPPLCYKR